MAKKRVNTASTSNYGDQDKDFEPESESLHTVSNEKILNELHALYVEPKDGLLAIGKKLGLHLFAPRRKVNVLLIGNHSSGKSSFINWYVDAKVQKTGVAIETQGFTVVTAGRTRQTLTGPATLRLYPYLRPLQSIPGVIQYLSTELTPSAHSRHFGLVTFIDSPGLADGALHYPFDIDRAMLWLGESADLIFVFFDPIGQALCKRTLNLVEHLTHQYSERMRFFLSKADQAGEESDRQKVMMQIVQELCKRPGLNQCGFEMSTIYIPNHADLKQRDTMCVNQIEETCAEIEKTIDLTIQSTFNSMERDIEQLEELAKAKLAANNVSFKNNIYNGLKLLLVFLLCIQFPVAVSLEGFFASWKITNNSSFYSPYYSSLLKWTSMSGEGGSDWYLYYPLLVIDFLCHLFLLYLYGLNRLLQYLLPASSALFSSCLFALPILLVARFSIRFKKQLGFVELAEVRRIVGRLEGLHRKRREQLYSAYLNQMLHDVDISH